MTQVILSSLSVIGHTPKATADAYSGGASWAVDVEVRMNLVDLETARIRRRASGMGGTAGVMALIPGYIDNTLGKGVDQAFRTAFKNMYRAQEVEETPEEKAIAPAESP